MANQLRNKSISILGCGWLGQPLAVELLQSNFQVLGTTTQTKKLELLSTLGIKSSLFKFPYVNRIKPEIFESDLFFINIPPKLRSQQGHQALEHLVLLLDKIKSMNPNAWVIYASTTGVYNGVNKVSETNTEYQENYRMLEEAVENRFKNKTIIRFSGLFDSNRPIINHLSGKKITSNPSEPVNLIHRKDAIGITKHIIENDIVGIVNASCPTSTSKTVFYTKAAEHFKLAPPVFMEDLNKPFKRIISISGIKYEYQYQDALAFLD